MSNGQRGLGAVVVGTGFGCLTHVRALRSAGFEVRALVGRNPDRTAARAGRMGVGLGLTSMADALALDGVDAVTIATPPHTHADLALEAIAAGRHVLCEKPFARDAAEARTVRDAAAEAGVIHMLGTEFRWATGQAHMARLVAEGVIGDPRMALFVLHIPLLADPAAQVPDWWSDADRGGGWLGAHASHVVDQVLTTLGPIEGVSAGLPRVTDRGWTAEDSYLVHFRTRSGAEGTMQSTASDRGPILITTRIVGSRATVWADGDAVSLADPTGTRRVDPPADLVLSPGEPPPADLMVTEYDLLHSTGIDQAPYGRLVEVFRDRILGRAVPADPAPATFDDGVAGMLVLDAIRRSSSEHAWVPIEPLS